MRRLSGLISLLAALSLSGIACGSDDSGMMDPEESGHLAPGTARVTIGGTTWTATAVACGNLGGTTLRFVGQADGDPDVSIDLDAVPADPPSNNAEVNVNESLSWRANQHVLDIGGTVPVVTANDGYGTGTATFVNTLDPNWQTTGVFETAEGEYEFNCRS